MSAQTTLQKPFGVFSEMKACEEIFLKILREKKDIDYEQVIAPMNALEQKFLKEYPWAAEENYFVLPNEAFRQILISINNPHKYKLFELFKGEWKESPNTKDLNYFNELPKDKPFVLHKIMICNDFIAGFKEREFAGQNTCVPIVLTDFSVLQKIIYEDPYGDIQEAFEKDLRGMEDSQFFELIPKTKSVTSKTAH